MKYLQGQQGQSKTPTTVKKGDTLRFTARVGDELKDLVGCVEVVKSSREAREEGLVNSKSRKSGVVVGLKVLGFTALFWKKRSYCRPVRRESSHSETRMNGRL